MKVSIIVPTYNNYKDTRECIHSLLLMDYEDYEIVVVDNGSSDDSIEKLKEEMQNVTYLRSKENLGYTGGINIGIGYAIENASEYIWLLNNDTVVDSSALKQLVNAATRDIDIGMVGSMIYYYSSTIINYAGGSISNFTGLNKHEGNGMEDDGRFGCITETSFVNGASMLLNTKMMEDIGLFDEAFYLYCEDVDLSIRAKKAGWKLVFTPYSKVWHKISLTIGTENPVVSYYLTRNSLYLCRKHMTHCLCVSMLANLRYHVLNHLIKYALNRTAKYELEKAKMALVGYWDFMTNNMGKYTRT